MEAISIRYGETLELALTSDDALATEATLYIGNPGEIPVLSLPVNMEQGVAFFSFTPEQMEIPLGEYKYQVNVLHSDGKLEKYPAPEDCDEGELPTLTVYEALDETEVVS